MQEQGKSVRNLPPEEEGAAEKICGELTTIPILCYPVLLCEEEVEKLEVKLSLGRIEDGGRGFKICFYFSLFYSDLIGNKLISLSQVCFACDHDCSLLLFQSTSLLFFFLSLVQLNRGVAEWQSGSFSGHLVSIQGHPTTHCHQRIFHSLGISAEIIP